MRFPHATLKLGPREPHNYGKITNTVIQKDHYNYYYRYQNSGSKKYGVSMRKVLYYTIE